MRLRRLLCLAAAVSALAGVADAQTATPLTVKDGNGNLQSLGEYKPDGTNMAGWNVEWLWNSGLSSFGLQPTDSGFRPYVNIYAMPSVSLTGALPGFASTPAFTLSGTLPAFAATPGVKQQDSGGGDATDPTNHAVRVNAPLVYNILNPSGLTYSVVATPLTGGNNYYSPGNLLCSSTTAATCTSGLPSFSLPLSGGRITGYHLQINDPTTTAWPLNATLTIKEWSARPTLGAGDHAAYALTSGTANWIGDFLCTMNGEEGDGATGYCNPIGPTPELKGVSSVYIALIATGGSGNTTVSGFTVTLVPSVEQ